MNASPRLVVERSRKAKLLSTRTSNRNRRGSSGPKRVLSNPNLMANNNNEDRSREEQSLLPIIRTPRKRSSTNLRAFHSSLNQSFSSRFSDSSRSQLSLSETDILQFEADDAEELRIIQRQPQQQSPPTTPNNNNNDSSSKMTKKNAAVTASSNNRLLAMANDFVQQTIQQ